MKYFGTDGIRGKAYQLLTPKLAFRFGQALVKVLKSNEIAIALDTRQSGMMLSHALANGAMLAGCHVHFLGVMPTPSLFYYSLMNQMLGVMVTASHNPYTDNGIKVFYQDEKIKPEIELSIEAFIDSAEVIVDDSFGTFF